MDKKKEIELCISGVTYHIDQELASASAKTIHKILAQIKEKANEVGSQEAYLSFILMMYTISNGTLQALSDDDLSILNHPR